MNSRYSNRNSRRNFCVLVILLHTEAQNFHQASPLSGRTFNGPAASNMNLNTGHRGPRYLPPPSLSHLLSHYPSPTPFFTSLSAIILASEILPMFYFSGAPSPGAQMPHPTCQGPCFRAALPQRLSGFRFFLLVSDTLHLAPSHPWLLPVSLSAQCANFSGPVPPSYVPHTAQTKAEDVTS